jgi:hypothetical protein
MLCQMLYKRLKAGREQDEKHQEKEAVVRWIH